MAHGRKPQNKDKGRTMPQRPKGARKKPKFGPPTRANGMKDD